MELTPVIENFLNQCKQHTNVVSVTVEEASQMHLIQAGRLNLVVFHFIITVDTKNTPIDFVVPIENINENSYKKFTENLDDFLTCDCLVQGTSTHPGLKLDIQNAAMNNRGPLTYYIRPPDGYRQMIYSEYADEITPTDPVFLELIEKLKNVEHVIDVKVEKLLDTSLLTEEEQQVSHVFFRVKYTIGETTEERYAHFIMAEPSCCNELEHYWAIEQLTNLIKASVI
jgi:predicted RNA-binding protein with PIN domain